MEYERQSGDAITERFKIAVVTRYATVDHHDLVATASSDARQNDERFRTKILNTLQSGKNFSSTGVRSDVYGDPMDVGAIDDKGEWTRKCQSCDKPGHYARDCRQPIGGDPKGKEKGAKDKSNG
eukprot:4375401-Heterocapsa_arctica.AAC.1